MTRAGDRGEVTSRIAVPADGVALLGRITLPPEPRALVIVVHGGASSRSCEREQLVAARLGGSGIATLLLDLITAEEAALDARTGELRFDVGRLARRLVAAAEWLDRRPGTADLPLGAYGCSVGAAAALVAAALRPAIVRAVVSAGGRPDLAGRTLAHVEAPTLMVVGARNVVELGLSRAAFAALRGPRWIEVLPAVGQRFEEPGAMDRVARLARAWFERWLVRPAIGRPAPPPGG